MQRIIAKLAIGLAITATGMFAADSAIGTWKYNPAKSKTTSSNPLVSQTDVREATPDGGLKVTRTGQFKDGSSATASYTFKYDGKEYPVTGGPFDTLSVKRIDANNASWQIKKTGTKFNVKGRTVVSADGKTMTMTSKGTDTDGKPVEQTLVFDKQ
jgi:hypothetical protein